MNPPDAILFDLDGCLVDSTVAITGAINHALQTVSLPARPMAELTRFIGPPLVDSFAAMLAEGGADPAQAGACLTAYRDRYRTSSLVDTEVVAGIPEALDRLVRRSRLAVVTSKPLLFALPILERLGLRDWFAAVHGPAADQRVEPKAVTLARAMNELTGAGAAGAAVMVGDRSHDVIAGRACGIGTVGVTWGIGNREELLGAGADHLVDRPDELVALLAGSGSPRPPTPVDRPGADRARGGFSRARRGAR